MARLAFQSDSDNQFELSILEYRFPIGEQAIVYLEAEGATLMIFLLIRSIPFSVAVVVAPFLVLHSVTRFIGREEALEWGWFTISVNQSA